MSEVSKSNSWFSSSTEVIARHAPVGVIHSPYRLGAALAPAQNSARVSLVLRLTAGRTFSGRVCPYWAEHEVYRARGFPRRSQSGGQATTRQNLPLLVGDQTYVFA